MVKLRVALVVILSAIISLFLVSCISYSQGTQDSGPCDAANLCNYDGGDIVSAMDFQVKALDKICPGDTIAGIRADSIPLDSCHVLVVFYWKDDYAAAGCLGHCIPSEVIYYLIDITTDSLVIYARYNPDKAPPEYYNLSELQPGTSLVADKEGKEYVLDYRNETPLDANHPPTVFRSTIASVSPLDGKETFIPLPLE